MCDSKFTEEKGGGQNGVFEMKILKGCCLTMVVAKVGGRQDNGGRVTELRHG